MKRFFALFGAALLFATSPAHASRLDDSKQFVDHLASSVLKVVSSSDDKEVQKEKLMAIVDQNVDIDFVAKFVLGKFWRQATDQQQKDYMAAYRPFLKKNYVSRLTKYSGQTYTLGTPKPSGDDTVAVPMQVNDPAGQNVSMLYYVNPTPKGFKVSDIVVEGVSLLTTQRSEFNSIASSKGIDYLISALQKQAQQTASN